MKDIKFSILIPAFKSKFLSECIESILKQTYSNFELVIVNDASPENIYSIVSQYPDKRIRYFENERNYGALNVVDNWNRCLSYAEGDYAICMGDDDKLLPICLEEYYNLINKYPEKKLYHGWTEIINENSDIILMQEPRPMVESVYSMIWNRWKGRLQYIGDFLFEVNELRLNGGFYKLPLAWGSDDISSYIAASKCGVANSQIPLFQYRVNSYTISSTTDAKTKIGAIRKEQLWYNQFLKDMPNNAIDSIYWNMINSELPKYIKGKIIREIKMDLYSSPFKKMFSYLFKRKQFGLSFAEYSYTVVDYIKSSVVSHQYKSKK